MTNRDGEQDLLHDRHDVVICGASFGGLAAARELSGSGADVLVLDRYDLGERATSACGIPTDWLRELGMIDIELQRFGELVVHTPGGTTVLDLPYTFSTFNYDEMCWALWRDCDAAFEIATVIGRGSEDDGEIEVETDRGPVRAPHVIDAAGWQRILGNREGYQPTDAALTRALEVHPRGKSEDLEVWVDRRYARAGYGWCFPAGEELRIGACSYKPHDHVREGTDRLAADLGRERVRYQGNWIPHRMRPAAEGNVLFVGDSAGQCLPLTAEGIRTALYYGIAAGRELGAVLQGRQSRDQAIANYARLHHSHRRGFNLLLFFQRLIPRIPPRLLAPAFRIYKSRPLVNLTFNGYLRLAPPGFAAEPSGVRPAEEPDAARELSATQLP
ncbi:MAG TPA: NAD(P)/FAD-dependent oxidoreductase [Solirubrobacterales bacterium]